MTEKIKTTHKLKQKFTFDTSDTEVTIICCQQKTTTSVRTTIDLAVDFDEAFCEVTEDGQLSMFQSEKKESTEETLNRVTFDVGTGRTFETVIRDEKSKTREITFGCATDAFASIVPCKRKITDQLISLLTERIGCEFPIRPGMERFEHFILYNRFRGYPAEFYHGIPYASGRERVIDASFVDILKAIDVDANPDDLYRNLGLPEGKALRSIVFQSPALLFYAAEIKALPFKNYDVLRSVLRNPAMIVLLSEAHHVPAIYEFIRALVLVKGEAQTWKTIACNIDDLRNLTAYWNIAATTKKEDARSYHGNFEEIQKRFEPEYDAPSKTNLPIAYSSSERLLEDVIDEYSFLLPNSTDELSLGAQLLQNCLTGYWMSAIAKTSTIFLILKNCKITGAVELKKNSIVQAKLRKNQRIEGNPSLHTALQKWAALHGLEIRKDTATENGFVEIDDDDMPF